MKYLLSLIQSLFPTPLKHQSPFSQPHHSAELNKKFVRESRKLTTVLIPLFIISLSVQPAQAREQEKKNMSVAQIFNSSISPIANHQIQPGDTLWELSQAYDTSPQAIATHNEIDPNQFLQIGETLQIPLKQEFQFEPSPLSPLPIGAVGGAFPLETSQDPTLISIQNQTIIPPIPRVIGQQKTVSQAKKQESVSQLPIQQFLADVAQLRANYTEQSQAMDHLERNNPEKAFSPIEPSSNSSSDQSLATAPIKVEFYNRFLNSPIGETVGPELPPLSSPEQYLPNSPQKFNGYIWPAEGVFTSGYGMRWGRMHRGIDIAAPIGTPIVAAAPGEVVVAGWSRGGYGNLVKVKHPDGSLTLYAHNNKILVRKGQEVTQGQQIAEMGSTGRSTGPHLHFEIHPSGKGAVNPLAYLPQR